MKDSRTGLSTTAPDRPCAEFGTSAAPERCAHDLGFDILGAEPDSLRIEAERWCGGDFRRIFLEGVLPHVPRKALVLELGAAGGSWTEAMLRGIPDSTVVVADPTCPARPGARRGARLEAIPLEPGTRLDLPDAAVDFVFSFGLLCRMELDAIAPLLVELRRVAKPGARALLHFGDDAKRAAYAAASGIPDDGSSAWPSCDADAMAAMAGRAGWEVERPDAGFLRRDGVALLRAPSGPGKTDSVDHSAALARLRGMLDAGDPEAALAEAIRLKALHRQLPDLDHLRARAFQRLGRGGEALEACKEELRWNPGNRAAAALLEALRGAGGVPALPEDPEFREIFELVRPYTMLSVDRLWSLFSHAREICREDLPGDFVECGVAAGGSSALLSWTVRRHSLRPRRVHSFDTFEGMPAPTDEDRHAGVAAEDTGWGTATCSAPLDSLLQVCAAAGTTEIVNPVVGLFQDTLPVRRSGIGAVAFLHMDGDWYESTRAILDNLYDQVVPRGFVQVDDYGHWDGCRKAVHEFMDERRASWDLARIDGTGVWFRKPSGDRFATPRAPAAPGIDPVRSGLAMLERDDAAGALSHARALLAEGVFVEGLHMLEAVALLRLGRRDEGIRSLRTETARFPGNAAARAALADLGADDAPPPVDAVRKPSVRTVAAGGVYVNIGCGGRFDASWTNFDVRPASPSVRAMDAGRPLELADGSADVVYHSHVLEHLGVEDARGFLRECLRVLRPGGILRVVVPDLEGIARAYLAELDAALRGDRDAGIRRDWMVVELLDQVARHHGGGEMLRWWSMDPVPAEEFVVSRLGGEAREAIRSLRSRPAATAPSRADDPAAVGAFRLGGEPHRWMYDRHSLGSLLVDSGFSGVRVAGPTDSDIPGFSGFRLDVEADGSVRKPDSLFMEARRP